MTHSPHNLHHPHALHSPNPMAKLKLDLHDIFNKGEKIEIELQRIIDGALETGIQLVEIIPGKGTGQLMKRVKRFLDQKHVRALYHRLKVDPKNHGRLFVYFK